MPSEINNVIELHWKEIGNGVFVSQFASDSKAHQIYLKKVTPIKKSIRQADTKSVTLFLFHDLGSYHGRFNYLVEWLRSRIPNVTFIMMDFLGHGLSSGTRGHIENFHDLANDIAFVLGIIEKKPEEKWVALGHGVGGLSLLDLTNRFDETVLHKIDQLILSNFILNFSASLTLKIQQKILVNASILSLFMRTFRPLEIYPPERVLTHAREQGLYLEDPLIVRKPTFQTFQTIEQKIKSIYQDAYFLDKPTLILKSDSPYIVGSVVDSFCKGFKKGLLSEKKYLNLKHDLYNERENLDILNDISDWIQA